MKQRKRGKAAEPANDIVDLIHLVKKNPALYNYKMQRRRSDILNGWSNIAAMLKYKYTVEECRRKWKNLRDTYHQYRLRKPKFDESLSKWRYAKELDFLSNVYQPKTKVNRRKEHFVDMQRNDDYMQQQHEMQQETDQNTLVTDSITLVNEGQETFILTNYRENGEVITSESNGHMQLTQQNETNDVTEMVKHENIDDDDEDDDTTVAEVDYEEVCLYEAAPGHEGGVNIISAEELSRKLQYIDNNGICIAAIGTNNTTLQDGQIINCQKNLTMSDDTAVNDINSDINQQIPTTRTVLHLQSSSEADETTLTEISSDKNDTREELDLFFNFLKKKIQPFSREDITTIQLEFLNCVLRHEANAAAARQQEQQQQQQQS